MQASRTKQPRVLEAEPPVVIVGLGQTGLSCARYLAGQGIEVSIADSRSHPPQLEQLRAELPEVALALGGFDEQILSGARTLVISPGVSPREPAIARARERGAALIGDIELFARAVQAPVVAITGSNGKSTVTTLVGDMAREDGRGVRVGGNLGTPALELLDEAEPDLYVLELSSFQLETTYSLNAAVAAVLNISADHMDRYPDVDAYAAAKQRIYRGDGTMVINRDDPRVARLAVAGRGCVGFGLGAPAADDYGVRTLDGVEWLVRGEQPLLAVTDLRVPGRHNLANALAALAIGDAAGFSLSAMQRALGNFTGLAHRTQLVAERDGVRWINDSKATNVGAAVAAMEGMPGKVVWIAGGQGKGADFSPLRAVAARTARAVVLLGEDADRIAEALGEGVPVQQAATLDEAVARAGARACPGDTVLFSPACASFDMFADYRERGRRFAEAVGRYLG